MLSNKPELNRRFKGVMLHGSINRSQNISDPNIYYTIMWLIMTDDVEEEARLFIQPNTEAMPIRKKRSLSSAENSPELV